MPAPEAEAKAEVAAAVAAEAEPEGAKPAVSALNVPEEDDPKSPVDDIKSPVPPKQKEQVHVSGTSLSLVHLGTGVRVCGDGRGGLRRGGVDLLVSHCSFQLG